MNNDQETGGDERALEQQVEALARAVATTINSNQVGTREALRDVALSILRDEVELAAPSQPEASGLATQSFNPFGIGIPLALMGLVLIFLFPPVGLLMFGAATIMIAWGVGATLLARS